ncbi:MAG: methyltransferase type 11 [Candidatus Parcubacteria bacterium]|nr:MAG: methyltransferase type 11 [Candidatus Parcubacteria bacterium]
MIAGGKKIFNENYLKTYVDMITPQRTEKEVSFLLKFIKEKFKNKKIKILDLACGYGRHSIPLAQAGYLVTGVDYSDYFLRLAKKEAKKLKLKNVEFIKKDMRKIDFKNEFDLVINMFTSFGYFENENDNILILKKVYQALKKKEYFIFDLDNYHQRIDWLIKEGKRVDGFLIVSRTVKQSNGLEVTTTYGLNPLELKAFIERKWIEGKAKSYKGIYLLYPLNEICNYLKLLNFKIEKFYGDFDGRKFTFDSLRMIIVAKKVNKLL